MSELAFPEYLSAACNPINYVCFQRKNKYTDAKLKALKARNEYILCLAASNTTIHKYFVDDLSDLIDVSTNISRIYVQYSLIYI